MAGSQYSPWEAKYKPAAGRPNGRGSQVPPDGKIESPRPASRKKPKAQPAKVFPISSGGHLEVKKNLLETLCIDLRLLRINCWETHRRELPVFVEGVESAWEAVRHEILQGDRNFILWLRALLKEAYRNNVWIPPIFIKRLRELERADLVIYIRGMRVDLPLYAGLPREFAECYRGFGWRWLIVPDLEDGKYLNPHDHSEKSSEKWTKFVRDVTEVWRTRPSRMRERDLREWVISQLAQEGWTIS